MVGCSEDCLHRLIRAIRAGFYSPFVRSRYWVQRWLEPLFRYHLFLAFGFRFPVLRMQVWLGRLITHIARWAFAFRIPTLEDWQPSCFTGPLSVRIPGLRHKESDKLARIAALYKCDLPQFRQRLQAPHSAAFKILFLLLKHTMSSPMSSSTSLHSLVTDHITYIPYSMGNNAMLDTP